MKIDNNLSEKAIISEMSERLRQYRIDYPMKRTELAEKAMVSVGTIARFENGQDISLSNLAKILKALDLGNNLDLLIPDPTERPSFYVETSPKRRRVRRSKAVKSDWKWGDEE